MSDNVIHLPRPRLSRTGNEPLGFFVRVGRNDHREVLELLSAGERGIFGVVLEAPYMSRQKELITDAGGRNLDIILDSKIQQMSFPGAYTDSLIALPWTNSKRHHTIADLEGSAGEDK